MRYTEKIRIRLTPDELKHLEQVFEKSEGSGFRSGRKNFSAFLRNRLLAADYKNNDLLKKHDELRYEIRKIGVNINQTVKKINAGFGDRTDIAELQKCLKAVEEKTEEYIRMAGEEWESQN